MTTVTLSKHDINVLEKIRDPESDPTTSIFIDPFLPRDPHVDNDGLYESIAGQERTIIKNIQSLEAELGQSQSLNADEVAAEGYQTCISELSRLIVEQPRYASARNNRVQAIRRLYGDAMLLNNTQDMPMPLIAQPEHNKKRQATTTALQDMEMAVALLSPSTLQDAVSPQAARTLSSAHTQRAAVYLKTSKLMQWRPLDIDKSRVESSWTRLDFEEAASTDLALGGRYGNQIAKGLAVSVNPTAKLCGEMVREAMKKEYGASFDS